MERCVVKILGAKATNFAACFYNEKKVAEGTAECISMRNFGELGDYNLHSPVVLSRYFQKIADHNKFVKHPQKHICWSFPGKANPEQLQQLLGHQRIDTTLKYAMVKQSNVKMAHRKYIG